MKTEILNENERERKAEESFREIAVLVKQVCRILGFTPAKVIRCSSDHLFMSAAKGEKCLLFRSDNYSRKGKIGICGEIHISVHETAEQIAKEIDHRFLPRKK